LEPTATRSRPATGGQHFNQFDECEHHDSRHDATLYAYRPDGRGSGLDWDQPVLERFDDNVGVTGYTVRRNGVQVATPATTSFTDTACLPQRPTATRLRPAMRPEHLTQFGKRERHDRERS